MAITLFTLFLTLLVYITTLTPSVGLHDSGDMTTAAYLLGICHPTGYPLYSLLGKVWITGIPVGNIAFRMNCLSAVFASLTVMMVSLIIRKLSVNHQLSGAVCGIVGALLLAFCATFWQQAIIAEKYTMNAFFFALITFVLLKWSEDRGQRTEVRRYLYLFAFILGLSFSHHMQTMFLLPSSTIFILAVSVKRIKAKRGGLTDLKSIPLAILLFGLPLILWLYLPMRALTDPALNWNNPRDFFGFYNHITGFGYQELFSLPNLSRLFDHLINRVAPLFLSQFSFTIFISILGIGFLIKKRPLFLIFVTLTVAFNIYMAIGYNIPNIEDYYIPSLLYISIIVGLGLSLLSLVFTRAKSAMLSFLLLPLLTLLPNHTLCNHSRYYFVYDHTLSLLNTLKPGSVSLYTMDYNIFPLWYMVHIEKRKELVPLLYPYFHQDWALRTLLLAMPDIEIDTTPSRERPLSELDSILRNRFYSLVKNNPDIPVYLDFKGGAPPNFMLIPVGFIYIVKRADADIEEVLENHPVRFRHRLLFDPGGREAWIIAEYGKGWNRRARLYNIIGKHKKALYCHLKAVQLNPNSLKFCRDLGRTYTALGEFTEAANVYKKVLEMNPKYADAYADLGVVYFKRGRIEDAVTSLKRALSLNPNHKEAKRNLSLIQRLILQDKSVD
jgi:hypothetical protein